jgi:hypothetical protein
LFTIILSAQIQIEYYDSAKNLADDNLKYELNQIIDNHIEFYYTAVLEYLKKTDRDPIFE